MFGRADVLIFLIIIFFFCPALCPLASQCFWQTSNFGPPVFHRTHTAFGPPCLFEVTCLRAICLRATRELPFEALRAASLAICNVSELWEKKKKKKDVRSRGEAPPKGVRPLLSISGCGLRWHNPDPDAQGHLKALPWQRKTTRTDASRRKSPKGRAIEG